MPTTIFSERRTLSTRLDGDKRARGSKVDIANRWRPAIRIWIWVDDANNGYVSRIDRASKVKDIPGLGWRDFRGCVALCAVYFNRWSG